MELAGTSEQEGGASRCAADGFLFLDVEERDKPPLDWQHRESLENREGESTFLKRFLVLFFLFLVYGVFWDLVGTKLEFGPPLPFEIPPYLGGIPMLMLIIVAILGSRRIIGLPSARIAFHKDLVEVVLKHGRTAVSLPLERIGTVRVAQRSRSQKACSMTLTDSSGRKYMLKGLSDTSRLDEFSSFCQDVHIRYRRGNDSQMGYVWLFTLLVLMVCILVAIRHREHPLPQIIVTLCTLPILGAAYFRLLNKP